MPIWICLGSETDLKRLNDRKLGIQFTGAVAAGLLWIGTLVLMVKSRGK